MLSWDRLIYDNGKLVRRGCYTETRPWFVCVITTISLGVPINWPPSTRRNMSAILSQTLCVKHTNKTSKTSYIVNSHGSEKDPAQAVRPSIVFRNHEKYKQIYLRQKFSGDKYTSPKLARRFLGAWRCIASSRYSVWLPGFARFCPSF